MARTPDFAAYTVVSNQIVISAVIQVLRTGRRRSPPPERVSNDNRESQVSLEDCGVSPNYLIYLVGAAGFEPTTPSPPDCPNHLTRGDRGRKIGGFP